MESEIEAALETVSSLRAHVDTLETAAGAIAATLGAGGKVLTCGNGGSAAEAMHLATELVGRFDADRRSLPALFLGGDAALLTCVGNDFGWEETFARPLTGLARMSDVLVAFSTTGRSKNVVRALEVASLLGVRSLALLGKGGGEARGLATWEVVVASRSTARVQEAHLFLVHWLCARVEKLLALTGAVPPSTNGVTT
jgi:D-sedoheptulose 7-phosphate isomerase